MHKISVKGCRDRVVNIKMIKTLILRMFNALGFDIVRIGHFSIEREGEFLEIYKRVKKFSTHSIQRLYALYKAMLYITENNVPGDIVECGVWKGGSSMLCARTLKSMNETKRKLFLYDTFEGMPEPAAKDITFFNLNAIDKWKKSVRKDKNKWNYASLNEVKKNMYSTEYPRENIVFVKGKVEETLPENNPGQIALLHLDTDWFESTYHELMNLCPLLSNLGVIVIDDYGTWLGQREAVDKYIKENKLKILLNRIDSFGVIGVKVI